ncbi:MAG: ATP-binding protein [Cyclobacteriaceae bacterium]|nr:ATP-binding protein [Cyclobacteriaceae bacterium]
MKTLEMNTVCPYTGLRSFTEEESLYFKGRDYQVDQITALLEQNKFLMVTGASGEGKSSLIYAGLIPNARAGFFKARYTNWVVADFRPERSPVTNMAKSLAERFDQSAATIETELRRGFSSLVDLYTNSEFFADDDAPEWSTLPEAEKRNKKRKAANLLLIVDQFEEFFTNPENYHNEVPSLDSQIVVNLVLETARIAIKRNLPVYVVCTMRSDYIGQCSAFRGLPEYIGFSQFFVPRLKRKDLKQVIEEPAILSGNRISQRLIERLVFDISEGVDQLPILQHALSQVWLAADRGREEMDLIHYAKVGGMPADELPDEDQAAFRAWFSQLPEGQRQFYAQTGLAKIIEIHASVLYENAWTYYNTQHLEKPLSQHDAKRILVNAFCCLTKIDNSRAVRNRVSLQEITAIINTPEFSTQVVGDVLNAFREEGNSFIRPFKTDDPSTHTLSPDTVLDITHESLIRNWNKLDKWAKREYEFYSTYLDFKKQLDRWKGSGKSSDFLLPIGPLTYFENWYKTCKPNAAWLMRYSEVRSDKATGLQEAQKTLGDIQQFLKKSARKVIVTKTFMKYGPQRIATFLAVVVLVALSGFYWYDARQKENDRVLERVRQESLSLMKSEQVSVQTKTNYLLAEERYQPGTLIPYLKTLPAKDRLQLAVDVYRVLMYLDKQFTGSLKTELIALIHETSEDPALASQPDFVITERNKFIFILARDQYYTSDKDVAPVLQSAIKANRDLSVRFYRDPSLYKPSVPFEINVALQFWLTLANPSKEAVEEVLGVMDPQRDSGKAAFLIYYPKGSFEPNGRSPMDFNNGYHTLASLYAATGDVAGIEWAFGTLMEQGQRNYLELGRLFNNHQNVLALLYQFGYRKDVDRVLTWIEKNTLDNPRLTVYRNMILRGGYISSMYEGANIEKTIFRSYRGYLYPTLFFSDRQVFDQIMGDYELVIRQIKDVNEREFQLALNAKRKAQFRHKYWYDRQLPVDEKLLDGWLEEFWSHYQKVSPEYLETTVSSTLPYFTDGVRTRDVTRRSLMVYPDYRDGWFSAAYHSDYLLKWLIKTGRTSAMFQSAGDLMLIHEWVARAFSPSPYVSPGIIDNIYPISTDVLQTILAFVEQHPQGRSFDKNLILLILANRAYEEKDEKAGYAYAEQLNPKSLEASSNRYEYIEKMFILNSMKQLAMNLAVNGHGQEGVEFAEQFAKNEERVFAYLLMTEKMYQRDPGPEVFIYLDSAFSYAARVDFSSLPGALDSRFNMILFLSQMGGAQMNEKAVEILREIPEGGKFEAILGRVIGVAHEGNFYRARASIPTTLTETQDLECRTFILWEACKKRDGGADARWRAVDQLNDWGWYYINYINV